MLTFDKGKLTERGAFNERRAVAVANAKWFRAMAWRAVREGSPGGQQRAANARAAARIVLRQAKRDALINRMANEVLMSDL